MHLHRYEVIDVQHIRFFDDSFGHDRYGVPRTSILQRCSKCGKPKVREIEGFWTLDELRGPNKRKP